MNAVKLCYIKKKFIKFNFMISVELLTANECYSFFFMKYLLQSPLGTEVCEQTREGK